MIFPKKQALKTAGKRKRQQDSPVPEEQPHNRNVAKVARNTLQPALPRSADEATTQRLRQAYPFLTHTRQALVESSSAHRAGLQSSFETRDELAKWKNQGGDPAKHPATRGNLAEWMEKIVDRGPAPKPNTPLSRAISKARAEEAEAQQADADSEEAVAADQATSQTNPGTRGFKAKRSSRGHSSTSDMEEEGLEMTPDVGKKPRTVMPKTPPLGARKNGKGKKSSPNAEGEEVESKTTPTKRPLTVQPPRPPIFQIPGLNYEVHTDTASELIGAVQDDRAYDSEETVDDPNLIEIKDAANILMSITVDQEIGRQVEAANILTSTAADEEAGRQLEAARKHKAAEPLLLLSRFAGPMKGVEHSDSADPLFTVEETVEPQDLGDEGAPAPVEVTFDLAHAPSRITNRPPQEKDESLLGPPRVNQRSWAAEPKKRKHEQVEET